LEGADWSKILFAFHEWEMGGGKPGNVVGQRVPDTVFWFPWIFANCAKQGGFMEHNSFGLFDVSKSTPAHSNVDFMVNEFHDSDSWIDWNPLYKMIRPEQKYDIHGGFAMLVVGVQEFTGAGMVGGQEFSDVLASLRRSLMQGDPPLIPADVYAHQFCIDSSPLNNFPNARALIPGVFAVCDHSKPSETHDANSELRAWGLSLANTSSNMQSIQLRDGFHYDRILVVRDDYVDHESRNQLSAYDTSKRIHVAFNAKFASWVPSMLILSSDAVKQLAETLPTKMPALSEDMSSEVRTSLVMKWMGTATGLEIVNGPQTP
jgi:hypothetical protein